MDNNWLEYAYSEQNDYSIIFTEWRVFNREHVEYVKSTIGLMLFGIIEDAERTFENASPFVNYYQVYNTENRKVIETIHKHVMEKCHNEIYLSCTYLVGRLYENNQIFSFPVLRYSRSQDGKIFFAERTGRYYNDWSDLISSIQLPPCQYVAPRRGLYTSSTPIYALYESPSATSSGKFMRFANTAASAGAIACTAATMCAFAPITFASVGFGIAAFSVGQSIGTLRDRSSHGQSIALNNRESILSYGNIVASTLSGASFAAISNLGRLQRIFGNYANSVTTTCKVLNISTVVFDSSFLVVHAYDFIVKLKEGKITSRDVFDLSLQIFLVCGSIVQAREMHSLLKQASISPSGMVNKKLTKTQKRNLQKRRAKARQRGEELSSSSQTPTGNTLIVGENDILPSLKKFSLKVGAFGVNVMMAMYPRAEVIISYYWDLRDSIRATFVEGSMNFKQFFQQIYYQTRNLYTIIRQDIARMQEILRQFIPDPLINNNEVIAQMMNNELDRIYQAADEIVPAVEENVPASDSDISPHIEELEDLSISMVDTKVNMILNYVRGICSEYVIKDTADALISFFHTTLLFTINYINEKSIRLFDQIYENLCAKVGQERAKKMALVLGTKNEYDFYPTANFMERVLHHCTAVIGEFLKHSTGVEFKEGDSTEDTSSLLAQEIFDEYIQLLSSMYTQVNEHSRTDELGVLRMTYTLRSLNIALEKKLLNDCRQISAESRSLYEENIQFLGQLITEEMMKTIDMPTTESGFFQSALKLLNTRDIVSKVKRENHDFGEPIPITWQRSAEPQEDKSHTETITKVITTLYGRIKENPGLTTRFQCKSEMFLTIAEFVAEKFITELKLDGELYRELKFHEELIGPKLMKSMLETIGVCAREKSYLFKTVAHLLLSEQNLGKMVAEFSSRDLRPSADILQPKIFDMTTGDHGFVTYKITCDQNGSDEYYKELIGFLFKIKINAVEIVRDKHSVVVKSKNRVFTFTFPGKENVGIVMLTDLDYRSEEMSTN